MILPRAFVPASVGHHYDELDPFYREVWGEHVHHGLFHSRRLSVAAASEALTRRVIEASGVGAGDHVCDVGCGYGTMAHAAAVSQAVRVTGLTLSVAQAAVAHRRAVPPGVPQPEIVVRDWLANGLPSDHFDAVWAVESTTHMPERARAFAEVARVLRAGGRFVLCVWMTGPRPSPREARWLLKPICREGRLAGMGTAAENRRWIEGAGLVVEREEDWSRAVAPTWSRVARRVAWGLLTDDRYRRHVRDARSRDRRFVLTVGRIWLAYRSGAMRYGFFVARKPGTA